MSSQGHDHGHHQAEPGSGLDPEVAAPGPLSYDAHLAVTAESNETNMSFMDAMKADIRLIFYSIFFSGTIIMEGYGFAMISTLFVFPHFKADFGVFSEANLKKQLDDVSKGLLDPAVQKVEAGRELDTNWQGLLPLAAQIGAIIGVLLAAPMTKWLGYKRTALAMLIFSAALVCIPFFANKSVAILFAGYLLQGIPWGVFQVVSPAYASEVASVQLRPILTTWNNLCWVIGQFLAAGISKGFEPMASSMSYRMPFAFEWVFIAILVTGIVFAPESPYWYIQKGRIEDARKAIKKLVRKGNASRMEEKYALMRHTIEQEKKNDATMEQPTGVQAYTAIFKGVNRRRTEVACMAWLIQQLCGSNLIAWAPVLFEQAGLSPADLLSINMAVPGAGLLGTIASWWLMQKMGRRPIYFWGLVLLSLLLAGVGFSYFIKGNTGGWVTGGILTVYTLIYDLTIGPLCYSIVSEIPSVRDRAATLAAARGTYLVIGLANGYISPRMLQSGPGNWGWAARTGFFYACLCVLGAVYTWFRIPETRNITARGMDILFNNKVSARNFTPERAAALDAAEGDSSSLSKSNTGTVEKVENRV